MPDVAQEAMEALLVLHHPEKIEVWNPEAPINTFWDVRWDIQSCYYFLFYNTKYFYQFSGSVLYFSEINTTPNNELHRYSKMAT